MRTNRDPAAASAAVLAVCLLASVAATPAGRAHAAERVPGSSHAATDAEEVEEIAEPTRSVCAVYYPQRCWSHLSDPGQPPEVPPCASAQECSFGLVACPVWETGTFDSIETEVCGP
jgi:hypothetical protein